MSTSRDTVQYPLRFSPPPQYPQLLWNHSSESESYHIQFRGNAIQQLQMALIMRSSLGNSLCLATNDQDSREYTFKRKASRGLDLQEYDNLEALQSRPRETLTSDLETGKDSQKKKQKLFAGVTSLFHNADCVAWNDKHITNSLADSLFQRNPTNLVDSSEVDNESPRYSESNASDSERHSSASASPASSSRSSISSHSYSLERDCQMDSISLYAQELPTVDIEHQIHHMSHPITPYDQPETLQCLETKDSLDHDALPLSRLYLLKSECRVAPIDAFDRHQLSCTALDVNREPVSSDDIDRSSRATSAAPSRVSQSAASSMTDADGPSAEGDKSSQSKSSSETSDSSRKETAPCRSNNLESLIKDDILRTNPKVAEYVYEAVKGKLECASADDLPQPEKSGDLSLLELLELQAFGLVPPSNAFTLPSSSSSSSTSSSGGSSLSYAGQQGTAKTLSATVNYSPSSNTTSISRTNFSTPSNDQAEGTNSSSEFGRGDPSASKHNDKAANPQNQSQKSNVKSSSHSNQCQLFRCPYNVLAPAVFSVNPDTGSKYRACAGPGWSNVQHLKEHFKSHHTKKEAKPNALQCSRCQKEFSSQESLRSHDEDVDCPVTCLICSEVFETKEMRQNHRKQEHPDDLRDSIYMEIGQATWKTITERLKVYTNSLKKGKGKAPMDPDLDRWVEVNKIRFEVGRPAKAKANARLELGQWYIIFTMLRRDNKMPDHPFYDHAISHGDYAEERILLLTSTIMDGRTKAGQFAPAETDQQQVYYKDIFREALRLGAKTKFCDRGDGTFFPRHESQLPLAGPSTVTPQKTSYNVTDSMLSLQPPYAYGHDNLPDMPVPSPVFLADAQDQAGGMGIPMASMSDPTSMNSGMWIGAQYPDQQLPLTFHPGLESDFQNNDSGFPGYPPFSESWPSHQGPS